MAAGLAAAGTWHTPAHASEEGGGADGTEHRFVVGAGGAAEVELPGGALHPGASVMAEWDAIEDWLELEIGASALAAPGGFEMPVELLVKKPFRLGRWAEVMAGAGPELVYVATPGNGRFYPGVELAVDFMFWPWSAPMGLWVEPSYDAVFRDGGVSHGVGATGGLLCGW